MSGFASRLEMLVEPTHRTSKAHRAKHDPQRRRAGYRKGQSLMAVVVSMRLPQPLATRLERVCTAHKIARGVLIRDALDAYLRVVERERGLALTWPKGRTCEDE